MMPRWPLSARPPSCWLAHGNRLRRGGSALSGIPQAPSAVRVLSEGGCTPVADRFGKRACGDVTSRHFSRPSCC
ncbi:hypothetical protein A176_001378 [Myxococcus hansupus]|uniref:Uncharacterized protein n=1 Tax=Pseudomyxococcus hansupus TaxID=1297742 RepID=A0A0H4WM36_9BACT|nr:hypothetical protein A176_001378 [Myxococcus hansupus]